MKRGIKDIYETRHNVLKKFFRKPKCPPSSFVRKHKYVAFYGRVDLNCMVANLKFKFFNRMHDDLMRNVMKCNTQMTFEF